MRPCYEWLHGQTCGGQRVTADAFRCLSRNPTHNRWPRMWDRCAPTIAALSNCHATRF